MRGRAIRVLLFTGICAVFMFALMTVFGQFRFDSRAEYHAVFSNVSGLEGGNFVRIAGVEVGKVKAVNLHRDGTVTGVHFNNRSADWLDAPAELTEDWYAAYIQFGRILKRPELELVFRLEPGQCLVMQNDRTLHGRTAFDPNLGRRHLQGCYIDRDAMESRRLVLRRTITAPLAYYAPSEPARALSLQTYWRTAHSM